MGGRSSSFNKKSVRGGGTLLSRTVKADKDEDDFEGTAYKRVNDMLRGMDAGELTAHVGNGHYIYTFSTTDHQENNFTSGGSIGVYTLTKTKQGWHLGRISGDIRGDFTGNTPDTVAIGKSKKYKSGAVDFKSLNELKSSSMNMLPESYSKVAKAMSDYRARKKK